MRLHIGKYIKEQRFLNNMTQAELGQKMGVDARTISSWEINRTEPKHAQLQQLCKIFGCNEYDLTGLTSVNNNSEYSKTDATVLEMYHNLNPEQRNRVLLYMIELSNSKEGD